MRNKREKERDVSIILAWGREDGESSNQSPANKMLDCDVQEENQRDALTLQPSYLTHSFLLFTLFLLPLLYRKALRTLYSQRRISFVRADQISIFIFSETNIG